MLKWKFHQRETPSQRWRPKDGDENDDHSFQELEVTRQMEVRRWRMRWRWENLMSAENALRKVQKKRRQIHLMEFLSELSLGWRNGDSNPKSQLIIGDGDDFEKWRRQKWRHLKWSS